MKVSWEVAHKWHTMIYMEMRIFHILYSLPHLLSQPLPISPSLLFSSLPSSLPSFPSSFYHIYIYSPKHLYTRAVPLECVQTLLVLPQPGATLPPHLLNELEAAVVLREEWRGRTGVRLHSNTCRPRHITVYSAVDTPTSHVVSHLIYHWHVILAHIP